MIICAGPRLHVVAGNDTLSVTHHLVAPILAETIFGGAVYSDSVVVFFCTVIPACFEGIGCSSHHDGIPSHAPAALRTYHRSLRQSVTHKVICIHTVSGYSLHRYAIYMYMYIQKSGRERGACPRGSSAVRPSQQPCRRHGSQERRRVI